MKIVAKSRLCSFSMFWLLFGKRALDVVELNIFLNIFAILVHVYLSDCTYIRQSQ